MKKLLAVMIAVFMLVSGAVALGDTITMGTNIGFMPFEYLDESQNPTGFDIEIATFLAAQMGKELKIVDMPFDDLLPALEAGTVDFVIAALSITPERRAIAAFSTPYLSTMQAVLVKKDYDGIVTVEDIATKLIAVQEGTTGHTLAIEALGCDPSRVLTFQSTDNVLEELLIGRADCILIDYAVAEKLSKMAVDLKMVSGLSLPPEQYGIAVKPDNTELLAQIDAGIGLLIDSGMYASLLGEYFVH